MSHGHPRGRVPQISRSPDLVRALQHYAAPGCEVTTHDETYGFAARAGIDPDGNPLRLASPLRS
jgi:hypothetical protein